MQSDDISEYDRFYALSDRDDKGSIYVQPVESPLTFPKMEILKNGPSTNDPITFTIKKGSE